MTTKKVTLLIYGAGDTGKLLHAKLKEFGMAPIGFVDSEISGIHNHLPVYSPDNCPDLLKNIPILISVPHRTDTISETETILIQNGWKPENILTIPKFYSYFKKKGWYLPASFWTLMNSVPPPPAEWSDIFQRCFQPDL